MRRFLTAVGVLVIVMIAVSIALAQTQLQPGDPPVASLISISAPDEDGIVTITGSAGAVFPTAQVVIRNLYTEQIVYTQAGITGSFTAQIAGGGNTPFWISPATAIPFEERNQPGSLPGGPGTIIFSAFLTNRQATDAVTQLVIDGGVADWEAYPAAAAEMGFALRNQDSLYLGVTNRVPPDYARLQLTFTLDNATYVLSLDPRIMQTATLRRTLPLEEDLGTLAVAAIQVDDDVVELRVPVAEIDSTIDTVTLNQVAFMSANDNALVEYLSEEALPLVDEVDGIVYPADSLTGNDVVRFAIAGPLAQGASFWTATGRANTLTHEPGSTLQIELDVTMTVPDLPESLVGLRMIGQIGLQPVIGVDGVQAAGGLNSNNGWSSMLTASGLAIDNLRGDFMLGEVAIAPQQVIRKGDQLLFGLPITLTVPDDLPPGLYVPFFQGMAQIGDGNRFKWEDNGLFGVGTGISRVPQVRLPLVLNVDMPDPGHLTWALLVDYPSDGSRGILAEEDQGLVALSNRVRFNSPTTILPPGAYPLEPYLFNQLPNTADTTTAPLIPLLVPGGRLTAQVILPDGMVDDLGTTSIVQSWVSSDPQAVFGTHVPLDVYRLTTLTETFMTYLFEQYGDYQVKLDGTVEDVWGNRYTGGGTYPILIAELLDMTPGVLPGTPFEVGDVFTPALHLSPGVPAEVMVTVRLYPLDGSAVIEQTFAGKADAYGYFYPAGETFVFETPGEYIIDYEARYQITDGALWAGSMRSAGVIAKPDSALVAHGRRGVDDYYPDLLPTWFHTEQYLRDAPGVDSVLNYPYHSGDVAWVADEADNGIRPIIQVQDVGGAYANWLTGTLADYVAPTGRSMARLAAEDSLPLLSVLGGPPSPYGPVLIPELTVNQAYGYVSAVRSNVTVSQFVQGSDDEGVNVPWYADDLYNGQIGAGAFGDQPGDVTFLFGGAVVRNAEAGIQDAATYAALAVTTDGDDNRGARVYPPYLGESGGANGGALFTLLGEEVEMFFHPTGIQPGQVIERGTALSIAGQVAPPLASNVQVTITSPSGDEYQFAGTANATGYYFDPANDFTVNEVGVWQVEIIVSHDGVTSAGKIDDVQPTGGVLGTRRGAFPVYVISRNAAALDWGPGGDVDRSTPPASPINFSLSLPENWTNLTAYQTVTMPGYLLDSGTLDIFGLSASYQFSPAQLGEEFPTLEVDSRTSGAAASDVVTVTFVVTGVDENGRPQARSRVFTVLHDRLVSLSGVGDQ